MSDVRVALKRGDTRTAIKATLIEPNGSPAQLTGAAVWFSAATVRGQVIIHRQIDVIDAAGGQVRWVPEPGDTDAPGTYRAEFRVQYPDGRAETYPNSGYVYLMILPSVE